MRNLIFLIIVIFITIIIVYQYSINTSVSDTGDDVAFTISKGESVGQIGENLYQADLIKSKFFFKVYARLTKQQANFQAGEYMLNPSLSIKKIVNALVAGQPLSKERTIKIIEGWNTRDIGQYLENQGMFQGEELLELVGFPKVDYRYNNELPMPRNYSSQFAFLEDKPSHYGLEGYLFPDTYRIFKDATIEDVVEKMLTNFDKKLTQEMRDGTIKQGKTIYEIVIMASLVEKEVQSLEDMQIVSGIFWDRIKNSQPLESCATVAYILGVNKPQYTVEETKIDSPYNTYQNLGLPPGPICNPGLNAIRAAIYPEFTDYNYFLNRFDNKETIFSKTLEEHNRNKAKYLK